MRKMILNLFVALTVSSLLLSCKDDDTVVGISDVPSVGQNFITQYFSNLTVSRVEKETDGSYDVHFTNGTEVDFDASGNWKNVDAADGQTLSNTEFIPQAIRTYLAEMYPNSPINGIEKTSTGYEVELVNFGGEVTFDLNGNYSGVKD